MEADFSQAEAQLLSERQKIDEILDAYAFDGLGNVEGYKIITRKEEIPDVVDCLVYVFGPEGISEMRQYKEYAKLITENEEVQNPKEGDVAVYFDDEGNFKHIGWYLGEGRVRSKLGRAHVYEHPERKVPTYYGDTIKYYPGSAIKK